MFGKSAETVDFGEEVDYSDYQWFKDPPPVRHPVRIFLYLHRDLALIISFRKGKPCRSRNVCATAWRH